MKTSQTQPPNKLNRGSYFYGSKIPRKLNTTSQLPIEESQRLSTYKSIPKTRSLIVIQCSRRENERRRKIGKWENPEASYNKTQMKSHLGIHSDWIYTKQVITIDLKWVIQWSKVAHMSISLGAGLGPFHDCLIGQWQYGIYWDKPIFFHHRPNNWTGPI